MRVNLPFSLELCGVNIKEKVQTRRFFLNTPWNTISFFYYNRPKIQPKPQRTAPLAEFHCLSSMSRTCQKFITITRRSTKCSRNHTENLFTIIIMTTSMSITWSLYSSTLWWKKWMHHGLVITVQQSKSKVNRTIEYRRN